MKRQLTSRQAVQLLKTMVVTRQLTMIIVSLTATAKSKLALFLLILLYSCQTHNCQEPNTSQQASYEACLVYKYKKSSKKDISVCDKAMEYCLPCLEDSLPPAYMIKVGIEVVNCLYDSHNNNQAIEILKDLEKLIRTQPDCVPDSLKYSVFFWLALHSQDSELFDVAIQAYHSTLPLCKGKPESISRLMNNLANIYRSKYQRDPSSQKWLDSTLKYRWESIKYYELNRVYVGYSNLSFDLRLNMELDSALKYSQLAIEHYKKYSDDPIEKLSSVYEHYAKALYLHKRYELAALYLDSALQIGPLRFSNEISIQAYLAKCYLAQDQLEKAFQTVEACDTLVRKAQSKINKYSDKVLLSTESNTAFTTAIEAAYLANDPDKIWYYAERNKANALYEVIARVRQKAESNFTIPSISDIQSKLKPGTVLLNYIYYQGHMLIFALKPNQYEIFKINQYDPSEITQFIKQLYAKEDGIFQEQAQKLYEKYIKPAEIFIEGSQELLIIPDAYLHFLPFDVLVSRDTRIPSNALALIPKPKDQFLLEKYTIKYNSSAALAFRDLSTDTEYQFTFTALAPIFPKGQRPLPEAPKEINNIAHNFPSSMARTLLAEKAREHIFQDEVNSKILHFSTHHYYDRSRKRPALYLSKIQDEEDGLLYLDEIFNYPMQVETVVLSNCQGVKGEYRPGEGVLNLSQAFLTQGVENIVFSLWSVEDRFTRTFMETFYQKLLPDFSYAQALRETKLEMMQREEYKHPIYWSSFSLLCGL